MKSHVFAFFSTPAYKNIVPLKRKHFYIFSLLIAAGISANAQNTPGLKRQDSSSIIEEKLVALALQGPEAKKLEHQNRINDYQLKQAQNAWLNLLSVSANFNERNFTQDASTNTAFVYPRYFFGVTVPLGTILSRTPVKAARESIEIGKNNQEIFKRTIREEVLTKYKQYLAYNQLITMQMQLVNDVQAELAQNEEKFRKGDATIEVYNNAQKKNNAEMASLINLKLEQDIVKLAIERLIGTKLEVVIGK
jgi:outer membrane protein TolC